MYMYLHDMHISYSHVYSTHTKLSKQNWKFDYDALHEFWLGCILQINWENFFVKVEYHFSREFFLFKGGRCCFRPTWHHHNSPNFAHYTMFKGYSISTWNTQLRSMCACVAFETSLQTLPKGTFIK